MKLQAKILLAIALLLIVASLLVHALWQNGQVVQPVPNATTTPTGNGGQGILPYNSGVKGVVMLGPTCPVMRNPPDPQCADKPYATMVAVFRVSDPVHAFAIGKSDARGTFQFSLPPGDYTLGAGESSLPRCDHPAVTVGSSGYATTTISCDTGIR